jgi:acetamidase/formamidase
MYDLLSVFNPAIFIQSTVMCTLSGYLPMMVNCLLVYSLVTITIILFFEITYPNKRLFRRQVWCFISLAVHWTVAIVVAIPNFVASFQVSFSKTHRS